MDNEVIKNEQMPADESIMDKENEKIEAEACSAETDSGESNGRDILTNDDKVKRKADGLKRGKKHGSFFWLVLLVICGCAWGLCVIVAAELYHLRMYDGTDEFRKNCDERMMKAYAVKALEDYKGSFGVTELKDTNFQYAVYSTDDPESVDLSKRSSYLVCTLPDEVLAQDKSSLFRYSATLGEYSFFSYNVHDIWNCMGYITNRGAYANGDRGEVKRDIDRIIYVWNSGKIYVIADDYYFNIEAGAEVSYGETNNDLHEYINSSRDGWNSKTDGVRLIAYVGSEFYMDFDDIEVCSADALKDYKAGNILDYYNIDIETWSVWTASDEETKPAGTDYYLIARVATPLDKSKNDLFVKSSKLIDLACTFRYMPFVAGVLFGILALVCLVNFCRAFVEKCKRSYKKLSFQWHENVGLLWRLIGLCAIFVICECMLVVMDISWDNDAVILVIVLENIIVIPLFILAALQLNRVSIGAERMASGDMTSRVDTSYMFFDLKKIGENINLIQMGLEKAIDERMKSERFKTELISNVSHDIKTPLTSIISYVELLNKQPKDEPADREYLEALERQSVKLKKLLEDLIEASKASTGNLKVELEQCNVNTVLHQVIGEYEEKLAANNIDLRIKLPEENVDILADTKHLQRVLDNLFVNISKYAQPGTRAYVNLEADNENAVIELKNTSSTALNITSDELLQRFVRGDESRNSEGNGLGLSIAKSLMELMDGKLEIVVDGDLFKAVLSFPRTNAAE